jgi:hypothetical protein
VRVPPASELGPTRFSSLLSWIYSYQRRQKPVVFCFILS